MKWLFLGCKLFTNLKEAEKHVQSINQIPHIILVGLWKTMMANAVSGL